MRREKSEKERKENVVHNQEWMGKKIVHSFVNNKLHNFFTFFTFFLFFFVSSTDSIKNSSLE